jgi:hypothetical protein
MLHVLYAIHDFDGRDLFNSIATDRSSNDTFDYTVKLVNSITLDSKLVKADLIKRRRAKYVPTPFGNVIYTVQLEFAEAVDEHMESKGEIPIIIN